MRKSIAIPALLFAWLCANGALLELAQVFAWAKMFSGYATTMPAAAALAATFDPAKPCDLCVGIAAAKEDLNRKQVPAVPDRSSEKQLLLACDAHDALVFVAPQERWTGGAATPPASVIARVPVPPPRRA